MSKTNKKNILSRFFYFKINKSAFCILTLFFLIILGFVFAIAYQDLYQIYEVYTIRNNNSTELVQPNEKIRIKYNIPISERKAQSSFSIYPQTKGKVTWERNYLFGYSKVLVFSPETFFDENQNYTVKIGNIESIFGTKIADRTYTFSTVKPFKIIETYPKNDEKDINVNPELKVVTDGIGDYFNFNFKLEPATELKVREKIEENNQTVFILDPVTQLGQGINYTFTVKQTYTPNKKAIDTKTFHFSTLPPVEITKVLPENNDQNVHVKRKVSLVFNKPVDQQQVVSNFSLTPETKGNIEWKDNTMTFTPEDKFAKNTEYKIKVIGGIKSTQDASFLEGDKEYIFKTRDTDQYPPQPTWEPKYKEGKYIQVSLENQTLYAYDEGELIDSFLISSGISAFPTPTGDFKIFSKVLSARMSHTYGPGNPNNYDLPGVPFVLAFNGPYTIHGTYWHSNFGHPMSHGCVNMYTPDAEWVYNWAPISTPVVIE
ncbi:MAG: L,D-transpeptidase family protein [Patescibacteria group bacterium]|jgi:lipoprotein-anchoring transpeptidase ErfK/SrfK